jgi:nucleotide-binding universal stress UspA family protein
MKTILVPCDQSDSMPSVLATADQLAAKFESLIEGIALRPVHVEIVAPDPIVAVTFPPADWNDGGYVAKAREGFDGYFTGRQAPRRRWKAGASVDDAGLGSLARVYDIAIVGRPTTDAAGPRMTTLEGMLFESGRPMLIAPPVAPKSFGDNIVISWNRSTEQARANADALPLLKLAKSVTVLTIEGITVPGPSGEQCCDWLAGHGINARELTLGLEGRKQGDALMQEATKLGADLIIKGAYTQSRLRHMIFGGATSHLLAHATVPVLMSH